MAIFRALFLACLAGAALWALLIYTLVFLACIAG